MNKTILIIFLITFFILLIGIHIYNIWFQSTKEGMSLSDTNTEYIYYPDKSNPNLKKPVKINYLLKETTDMLVFFKNKQNLIYIPPPVPVEVEPPVVDTYIDDTPSAEDAFAPPSETTATPSSNTSSSNTTTQTTGTTNPAQTVSSPTTAPITTPTPTPEESDSPEYENEYSKPLQSLDIYVKYDIYRNDISLSNELEKLYGEMFNSDNLKVDEESIYKRFQTNVSYYDTAYNYVNHFLIQKVNNKVFKKNEFALYIINLVRNNKNSQPVLDEIKTVFFKIINPSIGFNRLCTYFKDNRKIYSTKDDALFIINTALKHLKTANYSELQSKNGNVYFTTEDKDDMENRTILLDTIKYTNIACIVYDLVLLIAYKVSPHLYISFDEFVRSYKEYATQNSIDSFYLFLIMNPPNIMAL